MYTVGMNSRYAKNANAVYSLKYHLVWCPKYRRPVLVGDVEKRLVSLLREVAEQLNVTIHAMEVMPDHVHLFIEADPTLCIAELAARFKGRTSHDLRAEFPSLRSRLPTLWSRSYYAGSCGAVTESSILRYIEKQKGK